MNNILFKKTVLTLTLGLLSNTSIATNDAYDDEYSESISSATVRQVSPQYVEDQIERLQKLVFSGEPLLNIGSYLGRQEVGHLQQVSKSVNRFFNQGKEGLQLWKSYAQQLQLKVVDNIKVEDLIPRIKNYYKIKVNVLINFDYSRYIEITCFDFSRSRIIGASRNTLGGRMKTININHKDGRIESLAILNHGYSSMAKSISEDSQIIAGWTRNGQKGYRKTGIIWNWQGIVSLNDYPFEESHDHFDVITAVSKDGSDFIAQSKEGKTYKAHIPRYDLWKMR